MHWWHRDHLFYVIPTCSTIGPLLVMTPLDIFKGLRVLDPGFGDTGISDPSSSASLTTSSASD